MKRIAPIRLTDCLFHATLDCDFQEFWKGYTTALAFTSQVDGDRGDALFPCQGEFTDSYPDALREFAHLLTAAQFAKLRDDAFEFFVQNYGLIRSDLKQAGHDFHLSRNLHGAGFDDGDWPKTGRYLQARAERFGELELIGKRGPRNGKIVSVDLC